MPVNKPIITVALLRTRPLQNGSFPVVLRLSSKGKRNFLRIEKLSVFPEQWIDGDSQKGIPSRFVGRNAVYINERLRVWEDKARNVVNKMEALDKPYTFDSFLRMFKTFGVELWVFKFFDVIKEELKKEGRLSSYDTYRDTLTRIKAVRKQQDFTFTDLNFRFLEEFVSHHRQKGNNQVTINIYLIVIRAVFNRAINRELVPASIYPFKKFKIKAQKPKRKRAIPKETLRKIFAYKAEHGSDKWDAINFFKFSYLCRGMNIGDMLSLRWDEHVEEDRIRYRRSKTADQLDVKIEPEILEIMKLYKHEESPFVFPVYSPDISKSAAKERKERLQQVLNIELKNVARDLKLPMAESLSFYWARHSYANALRKAGFSTRAIGETLGHESVKTTEIYLNSIESEELDTVYKHII